jgi:succinate dehydrogenase/fumarate reductase flavoprotein subunit
VLTQSDEVPSWDASHDVVIVGLGCAGASAAIEAGAAGADVLVIEGAPIGGGSSAASHSLLYLGGGTPIQQACGFEDSPEDMYRYLMASCGPDPDPALVAPYCEHSVEHFEWFTRQRVPFKASYYDGGHAPPGDDGLTYSGNERVYPFNELARPAPRAHIPTSPEPSGGLLMRCLIAAAKKHASLRCGAYCESLVANDAGNVVGVEVSIDGESHFIRAHQGVVITTGGFLFNDSMVKQYVPLLARCKNRVGTPTDDGSGIQMGLAAGGEAIHMEHADLLLPLYPPAALRRGILVGPDGQRFINEDCYHGRIGEQAILATGGRVWMIVDDAIFERPEYTPVEIAAVAGSFEDLAAELHMDELPNTMANYNRHAARGEDPEQHKGSQFVTPVDKPPFAALDVGLDAAHWGGFTLGGLHIDADGAVISPTGDRVPGLYAAGRATSGIAKRGYSSGLSLGDASFFGRRAGRAAASDTGG